MKSKVGIINSVIDYGSTGDLTRKLYEYGKKNGDSVFVYYGRGKKNNDPNIIKIDSNIEFYLHKFLTLVIGLQGYFSFFATKKLIRNLKRNKIDKLILLNLHGYYLNEKILFNYIKKYNIQVIYITPDEYAAMGKCCYSRDCDKFISICSHCPDVRSYPKSLFFDQSNRIFNRKKKMYENIENVYFAGPRYNLEIFKKSALLKNKKLMELNWGIDTDNTYYYEYDKAIYEKYGIPKDKVIVLTVGQYSNERKGVRKYFFEIAKNINDKRYHFINVGYDGDGDIPNNMTTISYIKDQNELRKLYSIADLYVLASTADTMPLSCLISFACGTPLCCFYTSGLKYIAPKDSNIIYYVNQIDAKSMLEVILNKSKKSLKEIKECVEFAINNYSIKSFNEKVYTKLLEDE